ncbi:MAG: histidine kinase [Bacteroidales bacterium]|jgi:ligand-binding sensor domain-containing protein
MNVNCQEFSFREYSVRDGLPQSQTTFAYQDRRGFIWIGTRNGLSRFDGIDFINYYRKNGLPSNLIDNVFEDKAGDLWAVSNEGFSKYTGDGFIFYPPGPEFKGTTLFGRATATDKPGKNFILGHDERSASDKVIQFDNGIYRDYSSVYPALDTMKIENILFDTVSSDLLFINHSGNLWSWKNKVLNRLPVMRVTGFYNDRGKILISSGDTVLEYFKGIILPHPQLNTGGRAEVQAKPLSQQNLINYFDGSEFTKINLPFMPTSIYMDNDGRIWFLSESNLYRLLSLAFASLPKNLANMTDLWAVCMDKNKNLWLGSIYGDLFLYDGISVRKRNEYKRLFNSNFAFFKGSRFLSNGETWLSGNQGVLIWNGSSFSRLKGIPDNTQICYIYEDPDNHKIFLGTEKGMFIIYKENVTCFPQYNDNDLGVVEGVAKDDSGFYWMSGHRGLVRFDGIKSVPVRESILPGAYTYVIEKDRSGGIWVSSEEGLFFKGKSDKSFTNGVPQPVNKPANTLKIMDRSHLLVGRAEDLCLIDLDKFYNKEKDYFHFYDKTDGYPGGDCLDDGIINAGDGSFWILTSENVVRLYPERLKKNLIPPRIRFTGLYYEGDSLGWKAVESSEFYFKTPSDIRLRRYHNNIKITYTGLSTSNPEKVLYIHRMTGLGEKWSVPSGERSIVYTDLRPGQYSFELKGVNADGVETPEPVALNFIIQPAVWETNLFRVLMLILTMGVTIWLTWYIIRRNQKRTEEKNRLKSELSSLQMNSVLREFDPHFTFNVISSIGSLIMKNNREEAYTYITRLSSLLRTVIWDGSTILKPLSEELNFVTQYCELQKLRFGERFCYNISIGDGVNLHRELPKMTIQTFVENSIKHGIENRKEGGKVGIILAHKDDSLEIVIKDNGIGRDEAMKMKTGGTGYGLKTISRLFDIMNQRNHLKASIEINDLKNTEFRSGTEVIVLIPDNYSFKAGGTLNDFPRNQAPAQV